MRLSIPYILADTLILLMTEEERFRTLQNEEALREQAAEYAKERLPEEAVSLRIQANALRKELAINDELAKRDDAKVAVIEFRDPKMEDAEAVRKALTGGEKIDPEEARNVAYNRLKPVVVEGWEGDLPVKFVQVIREECFASVNYNVGEDRRFFWIRSQAR